MSVLTAVPLFSPPFLVGCFWLLTTAFYSNPSNTIFLRELHSGVAHNLTRFAGSTLFFLLLSSVVTVWTAAAPRTKGAEKTGAKQASKGTDKATATALLNFPSKPPIALEHAAEFLFPACCMVVMNVSNSVALVHVGVTLTYTVKATIPVWTCLYCYLVRGDKFAKDVVLALVVSCVGVALASMGDLKFSWIGFFAALTSCLATTAFNLSSKILMSRLDESPVRAFATCLLNASVLASVLYSADLEPYVGLKSFPVYAETYQSLQSNTSATPYYFLLILVMTFTSYLLEYGANFAYVDMVSPVAFAITDIVRRIFTIIVNAVMYSNPIGLLNATGILLSLLGALAYALLSQKTGKQGAGAEKVRRNEKSKEMNKDPGSTPSKGEKRPSVGRGGKKSPGGSGRQSSASSSGGDVAAKKKASSPAASKSKSPAKEGTVKKRGRSRTPKRGAMDD